MSAGYLFLKWLHIISSTVLFGTGIGIAFFFVRAQRTKNAKVIADYYRWWIGLGWPAFVGILAIFYLMIAKPAMWTG